MALRRSSDIYIHLQLVSINIGSARTSESYIRRAPPPSSAAAIATWAYLPAPRGSRRPDESGPRSGLGSSRSTRRVDRPGGLRIALHTRVPSLRTGCDRRRTIATPAYPRGGGFHTDYRSVLAGRAPLLQNATQPRGRAEQGVDQNDPRRGRQATKTHRWPRARPRRRGGHATHHPRARPRRHGNGHARTRRTAE